MPKTYKEDAPAILADFVGVAFAHYQGDEATVREICQRAALRAERDGDDDLAEELRSLDSPEDGDRLPGGGVVYGPIVKTFSATTVGGESRRVRDFGDKAGFPLGLDPDGRVMYGKSEEFKPYVGCKAKLLVQFIDTEGVHGGHLD